MTWLGRGASEVERGVEPEAIRPGLEQLGVRAAIGLLLFVVGQISLANVPYFPDAWARFLPVLLFVIALLSVPVSAFLTTFLICWAILYVSPAGALWFALFMLILSGIYEDRLEHAILLASTPVLLLIKLGFLPLLLAGVLFRARGGLVNGFGCLAAIAVAAALGWATFGDIIVTGQVPAQPSLISPPFPPASILDISWVRGLGWEIFAADLARLADRWAQTFARSPITLAQVILWGFVAIVVYQASAVARPALAWLRGMEWLRVLLAQGLGILAGGLLLVVGSGFLLASLQGGAAPPGHAEALLAQLFWSSVVALAVVLVMGASQLARQGELHLPRLTLPELRAFWRRPATKAEPDSESPPRD